MYELAEYAAREANSRGRKYPESDAGLRSEYQRDRDRIVHCSAFRRLEYKTQVFVNHEGDMFRTRLTHSLEVSQIGRTVARRLRLNEDLTEAICLAHDLGHTPFGHAGQDALNECMNEYGGFEHNLQSLRVVDELEEKYAGFPGLNLTYEAREGILKHCSKKNARTLGDLGKRFLENKMPCLEAQIANLADEIAYNNHDVDDGIRAGLLNFEQLAECELFRQQYVYVTDNWKGLDSKRTKHELIRRMINKVVIDLIETTEQKIRQNKIQKIEEVRNLDQPLVGFSASVKDLHLELKRFLSKNLYRHEKVMKMSNQAREIIRQLFSGYMNDDSLYNEDLREQLSRVSEDSHRARIIADYIAGMTDRFAIAESGRIT
ncbi:MAG: deoxyguanosinetriphosphate triphosphohydrolase [Gammaproteobacteria bacterium]|nr:deoxyguanosinetriphosphate triphosphohydrolase [Gammaproteobacteria bacterium]